MRLLLLTLGLPSLSVYLASAAAIEIEAVETTASLLSPFDSGQIMDAASGEALFLVQGAPLNPQPPNSAAVRVAVIDSGIAADHPQLRRLVVAAKDFTGQGPADNIGHGTAVALRLIASTASSADLTGSNLPGSVAILDAKVADVEDGPTISRLEQAVDWAVANGARIINLSLGFPADLLSDGERQRVCSVPAKHPEVLFMAASGNLGLDRPVFPAACAGDNILAVGDGTENAGPAAVNAPLAPLLSTAAYNLDRGLRAARFGRFDEAREALSASLASERTPQALFHLALIDLHQGDLTTAEALLREAVTLDPGEAQLHAHLGAAKLLQGASAEAEPILRQAIQLDPTHLGARSNLALLLEREGRLPEAIAELEEMVRIDPGHQEAAERLRALQSSAGNVGPR